MCFPSRIFVVNNINLPINASLEEAFSISAKKLNKVNVNTSGATYTVYRKSIDARRKDDIHFVVSVAVSGISARINEDRLKREGISILARETVDFREFGSEELSAPPLVVGTGPCGLFAALLLAENGYKPTVIDRGANVAERKAAVDKFKKHGILDTETNIQFGAGGAGTFSDGKLITRINDPLSHYILERLVEFGAPEEILYEARPHIGTDILSDIVDKVLLRIENLGGRVYFHTRYISTKQTPVGSVALTNKGEIKYGALILAIGHSARDTYEHLLNSGYAIEPKPFSVGMRIEHLTEDIDYAMYGKFAGNSALGHAEYNLSHNTKERGVYTFCMCPGGEVVPAASENHGVVVNGMSNSRRDGKNSNSAVVCSIFREDYGSTPIDAINFQREIERAAFFAGGENYSAPIITVGDFLSDKYGTEPKKVLPSYRDGKVRLARPDEYLPSFVCTAIKNAIFDFNNKIKGFSDTSAVLTGAETRTSAPLRILRGTETRVAIGKDNVYPCGEGAGYAGGITSAGIDGIKTAAAVMKRYKPISNG